MWADPIIEDFTHMAFLPTAHLTPHPPRPPPSAQSLCRVREHSQLFVVPGAHIKPKLLLWSASLVP